jgi:hypothetical protein
MILLPFLGGLIVGMIITGGIAALLFLSWCAAGDPTVNGDPERDAGRFPE